MTLSNHGFYSTCFLLLCVCSGGGLALEQLTFVLGEGIFGISVRLLWEETAAFWGGVNDENTLVMDGWMVG